jgi:hypothetical protein
MRMSLFSGGRSDPLDHAVLCLGGVWMQSVSASLSYEGQFWNPRPNFAKHCRCRVECHPDPCPSHVMPLSLYSD